MFAIQLVLLAALLCTGAFAGAIPLRRRGAESGSPRWLEWGNAFAAGVFLGAGFLHMLPDANQSWTALGWTYPIGYLLAATAIVAMLLIAHVLPPEDAHHALHAPSADRFALIDTRASLAVYAVLAAFSLHALLEGLALGTQRELGRALVIFAAVLAHKSVEGFALGVSLARGVISAARAWTLLGLFACATPLGILVGATLGAFEGRTQQVLEATFLSLAAGTFAYVATLDILREEFEDGSDRLAKWCWVAVGTALMALLALWV